MLDYKDIKTIYLNLFESLIMYGIIGWGSVYDNAQQKCQNNIISVACNKNWRYLTKKILVKFNILNIRSRFIIPALYD